MKAQEISLDRTCKLTSQTDMHRGLEQFTSYIAGLCYATLESLILATDTSAALRILLLARCFSRAIAP